MNVLIITVLDAHSPSGVVSYYNQLARDLRHQGMTVSILNTSDIPPVWRKLLVLLKWIMQPFGSTSQVVYEELAQFIGAYLTVLGKRKQVPDLIHAQDAKSGAAAFLALNKRVSVVMTCHFNDNPVSELAERFPMHVFVKKCFTIWYTYLFSHIKNYVFVSNYAYEKSKHLLPTSARRITIYNTVDIQPAIPQTSPAATGKFIISNVGYIDERKNQKLLIQIGYELRRRGISEFAIWIIGDGPKRVEYEQLTSSLDLTDYVKFYGRLPNPWQLVRQSDLYIHTALNDNCPYSIIEAFAVKTPVLALPVGGIPEMLPKAFGLLHGVSINDLTNEVLTYFNPQKRIQLKRAQAIYADFYFNHRKSLMTLLSFYRQIEQAA